MPWSILYKSGSVHSCMNYFSNPDFLSDLVSRKMFVGILKFFLKRREFPAYLFSKFSKEDTITNARGKTGLIRVILWECIVHNMAFIQLLITDQSNK